MATDFIQAEGNQYSVKNLMYPEDLDTNPTFNHNKILFFINVAASGSTSGFTSKDGQPSQYTTYAIPKKDQLRSAGQRAGAAASGVLPSFVKTGAEKKRLSAAIALHLPAELSQNTSVVWTESDMANPMLESITSLLSPPAQADGKSESWWGRIKGAGSTGVSGGAAAALKGSPTLQNMGRITPGNSKEEQLFKSVNFRSFSYSFTFAPKSKAEADNVMSIIRMFKHHMLPEFADSARFLYIYPSEFNIKYYIGDRENEFIEKQLTAVLTRISVNYAPNGQYNAFEGGMAQQINMSLDFTELALMSKETSPYNAHGV